MPGRTESDKQKECQTEGGKKHVFNSRHHRGGVCVRVGRRERGKLSQATDVAKQTGICPVHLSVSTPQQDLLNTHTHTDT